ncbi:hypothetical protein KSP39_PZI007548 [Platanthera zijinensis]|uniref:Uncharacterized protein n=1 Tax=Platanthera zijinensis TaxID=2320716 RepID=A0AAP0G8I5_9ASPA
MASLPVAPVPSSFYFRSVKRASLGHSAGVQEPLRSSSPLPDVKNQFPASNIVSEKLFISNSETDEQPRLKPYEDYAVKIYEKG